MKRNGKLGILMPVLAGLLACSDATGPDAMRKHQGPHAKLDTQVDWYSCSSWASGAANVGD